MRPPQQLTFLPLTVTTTPPCASEVRHRAEAADATAADCWTALLGGCDSLERRSLPTRLRELTEATSAYVGDRWWCGHGASHRRKVAEAQSRITDAVREGDGAEFAEAFVGYDQAIATAVVSVPNTLESPAS
ncbi:hypothetical protein [Parasphingorhabdus pacifica]